jgi:hypothetical protein
MREVESKVPLHLRILNNELPGQKGCLEPARRARERPHRRRSAIICAVGKRYGKPPQLFSGTFHRHTNKNGQLSGCPFLFELP